MILSAGMNAALNSSYRQGNFCVLKLKLGISVKMGVFNFHFFLLFNPELYLEIYLILKAKKHNSPAVRASSNNSVKSFQTTRLHTSPSQKYHFTTGLQQPYKFVWY
jgi:hypothetical protein